MPDAANLVYRGPVRIYYANPVGGGDNEEFYPGASVFQTPITNIVHLQDHEYGSLEIVNLDHVAKISLINWEEGQGF